VGVGVAIVGGSGIGPPGGIGDPGLLGSDGSLISSSGSSDFSGSSVSLNSSSKGSGSCYDVYPYRPDRVPESSCVSSFISLLICSVAMPLLPFSIFTLLHVSPLSSTVRSH
jgi:hypothetical protein